MYLGDSSATVDRWIILKNGAEDHLELNVIKMWEMDQSECQNICVS